ncbi:MAG: fructose-1,6-bisphosphatase [Lachnospiraceae bacterium]|nr:fructose-1,6-bisphosphatase [Lachnospiraceae bacterium]
MKSIEVRYLERLSELYPTIAAAAEEVINLEAINNLPKGTEHFMTDIHGEHEAFSHILRNGSGMVRHKIDDVFGATLGKEDKQTLATLIYYPVEKMRLLLRGEKNPDDWYKVTLYRLIAVARGASEKYTRSKVRKALPPDFDYILEELLTEKENLDAKESYYESILDTIIRIGRAKEFIIALCELIQRLVIDHLHIVGDIFDRGPGPHIIMDMLSEYHSLDIQWGNHDVLWMGAAAGELCCICNVIRICARYGNLDILEDGYGINLLPLASYAMEHYEDDPCDCFKLKGGHSEDSREMRINLKIHKAVSILQFKAEGQMILRHPEFHLEDRNLLDKIDYKKGTIKIGRKNYKMLDTHFPTVSRKDPYAFTAQEADLMERLRQAFRGSEKMRTHTNVLLSKGGLYKVFNNNLLYHGCIPINEDGTLREVELFGKKYKGRALYDTLEHHIRRGFVAIDPAEKERGQAMMWWIWLHRNSPLFGKEKMATFERYFLVEKETHAEGKNPYYTLCEDEKTVDMILKEFGLGNVKDAHIVNGHVPVKVKSGESPIKSGGKLFIIDGGFSRAYQKETGIAGYTLIYNSYGLILAAHEPFESMEAAIRAESDIHSDQKVVARVTARKRVGDTDAGKEMRERIKDLESLIAAYRNGRIAERTS